MGTFPFANCHCIIDSYESVVSFADAKGVWGFALSVLNPKFWHHHSTTHRCTVCLLSHLFSLAFTTSGGVESRAHLGPVSDLIVVSVRATKQSARHRSDATRCATRRAVCHEPFLSGHQINGCKLILCLKPPMLVVVSRGQLDVV